MSNFPSITNNFENAAKDMRTSMNNLPHIKLGQQPQPQPQIRQPVYSQTPQQYQQPRVPLQPKPDYKMPIEDKLKKWTFIILVILILGTATIMIINSLLGRFF